jgi:hypothetical protein
MKFLIQNILFFISLGVFAQKPSVSLSVDSKNVEIGDQITFTVKSNVEGNVEIVFPDEFIEGYGSMNGMEQEMDYNTGSVSTIYYFSKSGAFKENGNYSIYAYVKNRKAIYKSNKVTVKVEKDTQKEFDNGEISAKNLKQAVFGIIQKSKNKIYEGEFVVLEAKVYSKLNINMLEAYNNFEMEGNVESKDIDKTNKLLLSRENFKGSQVLTFNYGKQIVFPSNPGKFKIKPFEMTLQYHDGGIFSERISFASNPTSIEVLPLPSGSPKDFIGGVGDFEMSYSIDKNSVKEGDVAVLELTISGAGNLQNINKPKLNLPKGVVIYGDPEITEEIEYGINGAEGNIKYKYNLQFNQEGNQEISAISMSFFSPKQKKYITVKGKDLNIEVIPAKIKQTQIVVENDNKEPENSEKIPFLEMSSVEKEFVLSSKVFWTSVLSPMFFAFIFVLFYSKKKKNNEIGKIKNQKSKILNQIKILIDKAKESKNKSDFTDAFHSLEQGLKELVNIYTVKTENFLGKNEVLDILKENGVDSTILSKIKLCFVKCEEARYDFDETSKREKFDEIVLLMNEFIVDLNK